MEKFLKTLLFSLLGIYCVLLVFSPVETGDVWWHLSMGRWIVQHQAVPHFDPFPFEGQPSPWILTQWFGSTVLYGVHAAAGVLGLKVFRSVVFLLIIGIFVGFARRKVPWPVLAVLAYLMAEGLSAQTPLRPMIFNMVFMQIFLWRLMTYERVGDRGDLAVLPVLGIVWSNMHLGSFVYGSLLIGTFLLAAGVRCADALLARRPDIYRIALDKASGLAVALGLLYLALFVSPYGPDAGLYPFKVFFVPETINFYKYNNLALEMRPPVFLLSLSGLWFFALAACAALALAMNRRRTFSHVVVFAVGLFLFLFASRGRDLFVICAVYVAAANIEQVRLSSGSWAAWKPRGKAGAFLAVALLVWVAAQLALISGRWIIRDGERQPVASLAYIPQHPASVVEKLLQHKITGKVFCNDSVGDYLLWAGYPHLRPFVDSRQVRQDLVSNYLAVAANPQRHWQTAQDEYGFEVVLLDLSLRLPYRLAAYLAERPDWQLIMVEGSSVVFVKRGRFVLPPEFQNFEGSAAAVVFEEAAVQRLRNKLAVAPARTFLPPEFIDVLEEGASLFMLGYEPAGLEKASAALDRFDSPQTRDVVAAMLERSARGPEGGKNP